MFGTSRHCIEYQAKSIRQGGMDAGAEHSFTHNDFNARFLNP